MHFFLPLTLIATSVVLGQTLEDEPSKEDQNALSRLPIGATLTEVSIPRFDQKKRRASLLTAKIMEVKSAANLRGKDLVIRLFDKDQKVSSTATLAEADYLVESEQLHAKGELIMRSIEDKFLARSQGGILSLNSRQGLLLGTCETMFLKPPKPQEISMNQLHPILPLLSGIQILAAAPPPAVTTEELVEFERLTAPIATPTFDGPELLASATAAEAGIGNRLTTFLQATGQTQILAQNAVAPAQADTPFEDLFKPNKNRIVIKSDKGLYFDGENQELAYLGKVSLKGRSMTLSCTQGMKVLFTQPKKKVKKDAADGSLANFNGIGELKQFTATGDIRVVGRDQKGQLIEARGDRAVFDEKKQTIIIRGDGIGFRIGEIGLRTQDKNAYVVIRLLGGENLSIQGEGNWEGGIADKFKKK
ncbi:MAG: hypothetical protein ACON5H_06455 [Akkermansiaceae bacterium]